jgi:hypothetical protein
MPWGSANLAIDETGLRGALPWSGSDLRLEGQYLKGKLPWGFASLRLGDRFHSLTDEDVLLAIAAILSDESPPVGVF